MVLTRSLLETRMSSGYRLLASYPCMEAIQKPKGGTWIPCSWVKWSEQFMPHPVPYPSSFYKLYRVPKSSTPMIYCSQGSLFSSPTPSPCLTPIYTMHLPNAHQPLQSTNLGLLIHTTRTQRSLAQWNFCVTFGILSPGVKAY